MQDLQRKNEELSEEIISLKQRIYELEQSEKAIPSSRIIPVERLIQFQLVVV